MKKKINLKIVLGILFVILLILFGIFFFFVKKDEPEKKKEKVITNEILSNDERNFNGSSYSYWEGKLLDYITEREGFEPSLRELDINKDGDLVVTFKNFSKEYGSKQEDWTKVIEVFTINKDTGIVTDSKGNEIDIYNHDDGDEIVES